MTARPRVVTDTDVALLRTIARTGTVAAACRALGITRDLANYRLLRLERAFGGTVVASVRGGRAFGGTRLTPRGDQIVRHGFESVELLDYRPLTPLSRSNVLRGRFHRGPEPHVVLRGAVRLRVAFAAEEGEPVTVLLDPETILVARQQFPSSARNVIRATVVQVRHSERPSGTYLLVRVGSVRLRVAITQDAIRQLRLAPGAPAWLYIKATALRRVGRTPPRAPHARIVRRSASSRTDRPAGDARAGIPRSSRPLRSRVIGRRVRRVDVRRGDRGAGARGAPSKP